VDVLVEVFVDALVDFLAAAMVILRW